MCLRQAVFVAAPLLTWSVACSAVSRDVALAGTALKLWFRTLSLPLAPFSSREDALTL